MVAEGGVGPDELGRSTWTFLHTLAATHSATPTAKEVTRLERFMADFAEIYPCAPCAESFRGILRRFPVDASSGPAFAQWMCQVHNEVNKEIGKPTFNCDDVTKRWGACESCARHEDALDEFKGLFKGFKRGPKSTSGDRMPKEQN